MNISKKALISITAVMGGIFVAGYLMHHHAAGRVKLGAMPSEARMQDATAREGAQKMRDWIENIKPADVRTLNDSGKLLLSWEQLTNNYPTAAVLMDDYQEKCRAQFAEEWERQADKPLPERLAKHVTPDAVEIKRLANGFFRVEIRSEKGLKHNFLEVSTRIGK